MDGSDRRRDSEPLDPDAIVYERDEIVDEALASEWVEMRASLHDDSIDQIEVTLKYIFDGVFGGYATMQLTDTRGMKVASYYEEQQRNEYGYTNTMYANRPSPSNRLPSRSNTVGGRSEIVRGPLEHIFSE